MAVTPSGSFPCSPFFLAIDHLLFHKVACHRFSPPERGPTSLWVSTKRIPLSESAFHVLHFRLTNIQRRLSLAAIVFMAS